MPPGSDTVPEDYNRSCGGSSARYECPAGVVTHHELLLASSSHGDMCMCTGTYTCTHTHLGHTHMHTGAHTHMHTGAHTHMHTGANTHTHLGHTHTHAHGHTHITFLQWKCIIAALIAFIVIIIIGTFYWWLFNHTDCRPQVCIADANVLICAINMTVFI